MSRVELLSHHPRTWEANRYVYPVISRRSKGLSIGINLNQDKICNFDCVYCCVERPTGEVLPREIELDVLQAELSEMMSLALSGEIFKLAPFDQTPVTYRVLSDVSFSGNGEPTACLLFPDAVQVVVRELRTAQLRTGLAHQPDIKLVLITNATLLTRPRVVSALSILDRHNGEIWAKLDAGTEAYYKLVDRSSVPFAHVLDNIRMTGRNRPIVIQSLFMKLSEQPPSSNELEQYLHRLIELREGGCQIKHVQVYTTARATAESYVTPLSDSYLDLIADQLRRSGFLAEAFYSPK